MKRAISILILIVFGNAANAQQASEPILVKLVAFDRYFWLSSPHGPRQVFIGEIQDGSNSLIKVVYLPKTDGLRGGETEFIAPKTLKNNAVWRFQLRLPLEEEKLKCKTENYFRTSKNKIAINERGEPALRFRAAQFDGFVQFSDVEKMPCMIDDSKSRPKTGEVAGT